MPLINLIAEQRSARRAGIRRTRFTMMVWGVELLVCVGAFGFILWQVDKQNERLAELEAKNAALQPQLDVLDVGKKELSMLVPRLTTLQNAGKFTDRWIRILEHLSMEMPQGAWLTGIRIGQSKQDSEDVDVTFTGIAVNQELVGETMMRLNNSPDLGDMELKFTREKQNVASQGVEFEVYTKISFGDAKPDPNQKEAAGAKS
jgi:Tfp pilus assembly protein PilN